MYKLIIRGNTGININHVPSQAFELVQNVATVGEDLILFVDNIDLVRNINLLIYAEIGSAQLLTFEDIPNNRVTLYNDEAEPDVDEGDRFSIRHVTSNLIQKASENEINTNIAKMFRNSLSSTVNIIDSKVLELNKLLSKMVSLQNEIDALRMPIDDNENIRIVIDQINLLKCSQGLVEDAYLSKDGELVVITKFIETELVPTDPPSRIKIGKLEIIVNLACMFAQTFTTIENPIKIKNLTNELYDEEKGLYWQCGHAKRDCICFGGYYSQIHEAMLNKNISSVIETLLRFVRNPDIKDAWGMYVVNFPRKAD